MPSPYLTNTKPLGGQLKRRIEDFRVEEILEDGTVCEIEHLDKQPLPRVQLEIPANPNPLKFNQLHLWMEKFNVETTFAIRLLSRGTSSSVKRIGYAGLKDKRGLTCQRISMWKPDVEKVKRFNVRGLSFHHASWSEKRIDLGDLRGNRFRIVIRDIGLSPEETKERMEEFRLLLGKGLPNYYGGQRFGGHRQITHVVGKLLLQNKIEEAVMAYLTKATEGEEEEIAVARKNLASSRNYGKALKEFPDKFHFEKAMLHHLHVKPNDFAGAFQKLPQKTRYLFTHAYQSFVFNEIIAERLKRNLFYPIEGDVLENGVPTAILPGIKTTFAKGLAGEIEHEVLQREQISPQFFAQSKLGELSSWGARKPMLLHVHDFKIGEISEDELFPGKTKATVSFWLGKGAYATTVLRELLKSETEN